MWSSMNRANSVRASANSFCRSRSSFSRRVTRVWRATSGITARRISGAPQEVLQGPRLPEQRPVDLGHMGRQPERLRHLCSSPSDHQVPPTCGPAPARVLVRAALATPATLGGTGGGGRNARASEIENQISCDSVRPDFPVPPTTEFSPRNSTHRQGADSGMHPADFRSRNPAPRPEPTDLALRPPPAPDPGPGVQRDASERDLTA